MRTVFNALVFVISHDIFLKPPCIDHNCLKTPKSTCSSDKEVSKHSIIKNTDGFEHFNVFPLINKKTFLNITHYFKNVINYYNTVK